MALTKPTLGQRLKQARQALHMTQEELAKPGLTKGFISLLEHDRARPSVQTLELLAQRLKQPVSYFLDDAHPAVSLKLLEALGSRGRAELIRHRYEDAVKTFADMRDLAASQQEPRMEMYAIVGTGEALLGQRLHEEARTELRDALERGRAAKDPAVECRALHGLGWVEHRTGHYVRAAELYRSALAIVPSLPAPDATLHGEIWAHLGTVFMHLGRLDESAEAYTQAQQIFTDATLPERIGGILFSIASVRHLSGDYDEALLLLERARVLLEQYEDLDRLSRVRNNLGIVLMEVGRSAEALEHFSVSLSIKRRLNDATGECRTTSEIARCHLAIGNMPEARTAAERALALSRDAGVPEDAVRAQIVLAGLAVAEGDPQKAQRYLTAAAERCEQSSLALEKVAAFRMLAKIAMQGGKHKEAAAHHEKAFAALRGLRPHDVVGALLFAETLGRQTGEVPAQPADANVLERIEQQMGKIGRIG